MKAFGTPKPKRPVLDGDAGKVDAARDILNAVRSGDAKSLSLALERHQEACAYNSDDDSETEIEPDEDDTEV